MKGGNMAKPIFSSPALAKELQRLYGSKAKIVKIPLRHARTVNTYVMKIEEGHKKAAESKINFR
jgi:hypothetical protein